MLHVRITAELPEDETGPHAVYDEVIVLPPWFANSAREAHAKMIDELRSEGYIELPRMNGKGLIPFNDSSVREVVVWEG